MSDDIILEDEFEGEETLEQKLKDLRAELKKVKSDRDENLSGWQRAKADYVNLERRLRELRSSVASEAVVTVMRDVIPMFDSLEAAQNSFKENAQVLDGLSALSRQLEEVLRKQNVEKFTPQKGDSFDPHLHEPMQTLATKEEKEDNTVLETLQSGYRLNEQVIRPARVSVYRFEAGE
ncbi:nucleotide exchange factor GrpE [Candidatus Kaiserbacteria bacterium CG10_big_fil_rev_8_21_14_0_10_45_20]|uniref:Protein GrpE n=1 Tax=Candidatus Kaiserbacteria bacterium CG10_big_fil_rev_8_21_14_0_10_45_20 TaxID=1974607 RepID=A0A2H0UGN2_9BACT|nr:MAG: nucleotide exchange factor GrpE [Candidatus Kaiserbacteria bacterium CG10_big_fil_rev_8_21_14_0_10_45_20]